MRISSANVIPFRFPEPLGSGLDMVDTNEITKDSHGWWVNGEKAQLSEASKLTVLLRHKLIVVGEDYTVRRSTDDKA